MPRLCAFGCKTSEATTHSFPNLKRFPEQFVTWVNLVGGILEKPSDYDYYRKKIVCDKHFKDSDKNRNHRLNKLAVPTLFLPEQKNNLPQDFNGTPLQAALPSSNIGFEKVILHGFPNPESQAKRFRLWLFAIGGDLLGMDNQKIFKHRRVCHNHFEEKYYTAGKRLSANSVPTMHLSGNSSTEQPKEVSDHTYSTKEKPEGNSSTSIESASLPPIDLQQKYDKQQLDFNLTEGGELIEGDAFYNAESPSSLAPSSEIGETIEDNDTEEENIYSWQKTELIETDDPEDPTPTPVPETPQTSEHAVTLSLFCDPEPEGEVPSEPVVVPEDVEYRCNDCAVIIDGFSWWCVQCACGALCCACAQRAPHDKHYVVRAPLTATHSQTEAVLAVIRQQLEKENLITLNGTDVSVKEEVKDEPSCPSPAAPAASPDPLAVEPHPLPLHVEPHSDSLTEELHLLASDDESVDEDTVDHHPFKRPRLMEDQSINKNSTVTDVQQPFIYAFKIPKGSRTTVKVRRSAESQSGINNIPRDSTGLQSCSNVIPSNTGSQSGINDIARDNTESHNSHLSNLQTPQKDQSNKLARPNPRGLKTLQIKSSEITRPDINSRRAHSILKGLLKIQQIDQEPKLFQVPLEILESESLNVTSEVHIKDTATNLDEVNDVVVEYLDDEYLEYDSEENRLDKDIQHEIEESIKITESGAEDLSKDTIDRYQEDVKDSFSYIKNEKDKDKEYKVKEDSIADLIRNYTESEVDDSDLDKDFKINEEDRISDSDESDVEDIKRGDGRTIRNTTNTLRAPSEAIVRKAAKAVVHLEPLTALDVEKATVRRKVGRPRKRRKD